MCSRELVILLANARSSEVSRVAKVKIEDGLVDRARRAAEAAGYSSVEEFIANAVEKEIQRLKVEDDEARVSDQLRGLGYIE
jgi:hypothetical protein